jgi:TolB-like protein
MLVEFASAVDAARCSVEVQHAMAAQNADVPQDVRIEFRIGVHVGDIIIDDSDMFGDGVNIAARLEGIAEPGGVCISDDAYRQIRGKVEIGWDDLGPQTLKNIAEPMRAWRVQLSGQGAVKAQPGSPAGQALLLPLPDKPSFAVLPFQNMSGDPEQEYFADGIAEDITTALSRFHSLFVIARNSSFTYKGKAVDIKQVARELGVKYVLEGSVRKASDRVRVTAQLIEASTGAHLWADRFDQSLEDIFALQDNVTASVVGAIAPRMVEARTAAIVREPIAKWEVYDHYLQAVKLQHQWTLEATLEAQKVSREIIKLDPPLALAYARFAWAVQALRVQYQQPRKRSDRGFGFC